MLFRSDLPAGTKSYKGGWTSVDQYQTGLDYTKDFYNNSNITLGGGLGIGGGGGEGGGGGAATISFGTKHVFYRAGRTHLSERQSGG